MSPSDPEGDVTPDSPPVDPEEWTDEQWIAWLEATDGTEGNSPGSDDHTRRPRPRGGMLGAAMLGLRDAIYGHPDDEVVAIVEGSGDPPGDDHPEVHLDLDHPERSEVVVRPTSPRPRNPAG